MLNIIFLLCLLPFGNSQERIQSVPKRTAVEVTSDGRSGFMQRLGESLKESFRSSLDFSLSQGKNPDALIVTIRSYLDWRDGSEISCTVEFSSGRNEILGISIASCMSNELAECTNQILKDARIAKQFLVNPAPDGLPTKIAEIKSNPMKYDGRVVQLNGYYFSGHYGVSLDTKDHKNGIRLRFPGADQVACPVPVHRNELFNKFWDIFDFDSDKKEIYVKIEGFVRVLKVKGEPATEFYVFGQWPLEMVTTRIMEIVETN